MARIVISSWGSYGDLNPYLAVGLSLQRRGHDVVIAVPEHFRDDVAGTGLGFTPVGLALDRNDRALIARICDPYTGTQYLFRDLVMPAMRRSHDELLAAVQGADLLVSAPLTLGAPIIAARTGIAWASTVLAPLSFASEYDMPVPPLAPWLKQLEMLGPWVPRFFAQAMRRVSHPWTQPVADLRAELGLPLGAHPIFEGQHSPDCVLAMFSAVLTTPQPDWPARTHVTGQAVYDATKGATLPPALEAFLAAGEAPIVFTLGSAAVEAPGTFFDESITALRLLKRRGVFLSGEVDTARLASRLPPGICAVPAAPHSLLFPHAAAIVHSCGAGTMGTALRAGKPMLSVPHANDQPDNAWRIAELGVSTTLYPHAYRGPRVARALNELFTQPQYASRAGEVAASVRSEHGAETAADRLEAYLAQYRASGRMTSFSTPA